MLLPSTLVGAVVSMASTLVRAVVVGAVMGVVAVSGPWGRSDGGGFDDGGGSGGGLEGGVGGGPESIFRRLSYGNFSIIVWFFGTVWLLFQGST